MDELSSRQVAIKDSFWWPRLAVNAGKAIFHQWDQLEAARKYKELIFDGKSYPSNPSIVSDSQKTPGNDYEVLFDDVKLPVKIYTY